MIKKIFGVALMLIAAVGANAQQIQELPLSPDVKHGTLPNGLQYFIQHNAEPKERANFYIAQKVGSTLENQDQLGLAHFLEHMAFNGTTHYPGKAMLNYLQSKGIRFGADINAYTAFDETVYNINNVPTTDKALMDSVLLAIHDWSCEIALEEDEINAERGVIEEEWRTRNDANSRMLEYVLPKIYEEYQYQQMPIGKMEVVKNFKPEVLRAYYKKWYRPDQQGIVIVGDFDAAEMEAKVKEMFSPIVMPANAAERTYPTVSDNKEPIFVYYDDPELQYPRVDLAFKTEKTPWEMRNTAMGFIQDKVLESLVAGLINSRLEEFQQNPDCKYAGAAAGFSNYWVSKTKSAFDVIVVGKSDIKEAFNQAMGIIVRACKTGFTDTELQRERDKILAKYEKRYNERNNTNNAVLAAGLIRHFVDNDPNPGFEMENDLVKQILPNIPVEAINQVVATILTPENQVMVVSQPKKDEISVVTKDEMITILENSINAEYEAYVEEAITDPLLKKEPKAGKIVSEKAGKFETTEFVLSNGAKVIVKPTDFKADQITLTAFKDGGKQSYAPNQAANVMLIEDAFENCKLGNFDKITLQKFLAGKNVSLGYKVGNTVNSFEGSSTVKDLPTFMELVYASFTEVTPDPTTYTSFVEQVKAALANQDKSPEYVFGKHVSNAVYGNNPMYQQLDIATLEAANYDEMIKMINASSANAANYTFIFVGNVDINTFKPLMEKYIASLPGKKADKKAKPLSSILMAEGQVKDEFVQKMASPVCMVVNVMDGTNVPYNVENNIMMGMVGQVLRNVFTETLREEMGGTYSPYAGSSMNPYSGQWNVQYQFNTNSDMLGKMQDRAYAEFEKLLKEGAPEKDFNKVKEAAVKQFEIQVRNNAYWDSALVAYAKGVDMISGYKEALDGLTLAKFNDFMKNLYDGKNRIQVVMVGEKDE